VSAPTRLRDPWAIEAAVEVLPPDAPRELWLAERQKGLGGSDTSAVFGINQYTSPIRLWLDKTGRADEVPDNDFMEWGRRLEPVAADWFSDHYGMEVRTCGLLRSLDHPILQATPDRLTADGGGLEVKTLEWHTEHEWDDGQIPDHAELQAQKCMAVSGRPHWWVLGLVNGRRPHVRRRERDEAMIAKIIRFETWWWESYVLADEMPPLDDSEATNSTMRELYSRAVAGKAIAITPELLALFRELREAKEAVRLAEAVVTGIDSKIRLALGDAEVLVRDLDAPRDGSKEGKANVLLTAAQNGAFNPSRFTEAHPTIAAACRKDVSVLDLDRIKRDHAAEYAAHRARQLRPRKTLDNLIDNTPGSK
jgi:putative phage-type endonuclease